MIFVVGFTLVGAPVGMDMDLQTLVPQYSDNMTNSQAQVLLKLLVVFKSVDK